MVFGNRSSPSQTSYSSSSITSKTNRHQERGKLHPLDILTNAFNSVSNTAPISSSVPFPFVQDQYLATTPMDRVKTSDSMLDLSDPQTYRPKTHGIHVDVILQQATCSGWLSKHRAPTFSFMKNSKRRYIVLVDRILYAFKSETPETYREFLELTKNTHVFVTDQFAGELFCIEIKKMGHDDDSSSWFLQADDAEAMKLWLGRIKKTIACLRTGTSGAITTGSLSKITTEDEEYARIASKSKQSLYSSPTSSQSNISLSDNSNSRPHSFNSSFIIQQSNSIITNSNESILSSSSSEYPFIMEKNHSVNDSRNSYLRVARPPSFSTPSNYTVLPPQPPPPKSQLPPIPSSYAYL